MQVQPYLSFEGRCEEAINFYKTAVGAKVIMMMRFKEAPDQSMMTPGTEDKVLHAALQMGDSTVLASDGQCMGKAVFQGITLSLTASNDAEAKRLFDALANGGNVQMPLAKTFFASSFGILADKFGVGWMVYVPVPV
jgi:PhnB protein